MRYVFAILLFCAPPAIILFAYFQADEARQVDSDRSLPARLAARGEAVPLVIKCRENHSRLNRVRALKTLLGKKI
jgi:hypothetical protein